jgi:hypothetical protein
VSLSVCRESRVAALRHLTLKFKAYWDLEHDSLYLEVKRWKSEQAMEQIAEMRKRGLLGGFKRLAMDSDIWEAQRRRGLSIGMSCNSLQLVRR